VDGIHVILVRHFIFLFFVMFMFMSVLIITLIRGRLGHFLVLLIIVNRV